jgi:hypothetical protein
MLDYFMGREWPDMGWAQFGQEVEDYICERKGPENFEDRERVVLEKVQPLGNFQKDFMLRYDGFAVIGFIDDASDDFKHIRDYKTCSKNSSKRYYKDNYYQLDLYALWVEQEFGYLPEKLEVFMVERTGNPFKGGGRSVLKVGEDVWSHFRPVDRERLNWLREDIRRVANEISMYYNVYQKLLKL